MRHTRGRTTRGTFGRLLMLLCACVCLAVVAGAQTDSDGRWENGITEPWWFDAADFSPESVGEAQSRWQSIGAENDGAKGGGWQGDYSSGGETHGTYMRWSPQGGYVLMNIDKCAARVMGFSYGTANASGALVEFNVVLRQRSSQTHGHAHAPLPATMRFLPVTWRGVRYLIGENELTDFCDYAAGLGQYNRGLGEFMIIDAVDFFYKIKDQADETDRGLPVVPPGYERFVKKPIEAKITSVGTGYRVIDLENEWWDKFVIPVTTSAGQTSGVKRKMSLRVIGHEGFGGMDEIVEIRQVGRRSSGGVIVRSVRKKPCVKFSGADDCDEPEYRPLKVGLQLTTSLFD
ncbi:MAG: hypothetical protein QOG00_3169 [Pyrinomonadaceae bacterium]|nr:hypothetical protein [Pyrinomonadaceae bacterium]